MIFIVTPTNKAPKEQVRAVEADNEELAREQWCIRNGFPTGYRNDGLCQAWVLDDGRDN
jgi:hypothetical protein